MKVFRYASILSLQTLLLLIDVGINTFSIFLRQYNGAMLALFIIQDLCLLIGLATILVTFFNTLIFQAGLLEFLYNRFRATILVCVLYFILTTIAYIWTLIVRWENPLKHNWPIGMHVFYVIHRFSAPFYYYFYKRAALRISDPSFYEEIDVEPKFSQNTANR